MELKPGLVLAAVVATVAVTACGGKAEQDPVQVTPGTPATDGAAGGSADAGVAGEAAEAAPEPVAFVFTCPDGSGFAFQLPCEVGMSPLNVTECFALGDDVRVAPIWSAVTPLGYLASHLNEPVDLGQFPSVPLNSTWASDGGMTYGIVSGVGALVVSEVDTAGRSFVGRLQNVQAVRKTPTGEATLCSARDSPFCVVPGDFNYRGRSAPVPRSALTFQLGRT